MYHTSMYTANKDEAEELRATLVKTRGAAAADAVVDDATGGLAREKEEEGYIIF